VGCSTRRATSTSTSVSTVAGGLGRAVRSVQRAAGAGVRAGTEAVARRRADARPRHSRRRVADDGRSRAGLLPRHEPRGERPEDRDLASKLYAGGPDLRCARNGFSASGACACCARSASSRPAWHANEGHAAFMLVERVRELVLPGRRLRRSRASRVARRASSRRTRRCLRATTRS
jgi:hypothetical protein